MDEITSTGRRSFDLLHALCYEHGYVGNGVTSVVDEWDELMSTASGRKWAVERLRDCAELLSLSLDALPQRVAEKSAHSGRVIPDE